MEKFFVPSQKDYIEHIKKFGGKTDYFKQKWLVDWCSKVSPFRTKRIIKTLLKYKSSSAKVLDLGCGMGLNTPSIAFSYPNTCACDINLHLVKATKWFLSKYNLKIPVLKYNGNRLPFPDKYFDIVNCVEVIEHAKNPKRLLKEIERVLKPDGFAYITCPNKYWPIEGHYRLPFLSILPKKMADKYVRLFKKGDKYENVFLKTSYKEFCDLLENYFSYEDITFDTAINYKKFEVDKERGIWVKPLSRILKLVQKSTTLSNMFSNLPPGWLFIAKPKKDKLKIVILTLDHLYSNRVIKDHLLEFKEEILLIVISGVLLPKKTIFQSIKKYLEVSGFYYTFVQALKLGVFLFISRVYRFIYPKRIKSKFFPYFPIAKKYLTKQISVKDVNSSDFLHLLETIKPDLIISVYFNQILSQELLKLSKYGVVNIHPAFLPDYKGVSPAFWSLANNEEYSGVSVHLIDKGIDTGGILAQKKIKITKKDTENTLYWRSTKIGSKLLVKTVHTVLDRKHKASPNVGGRYFSLPTKEAVSRFGKLGRKFFRLFNLIFRLK